MRAAKNVVVWQPQHTIKKSFPDPLGSGLCEPGWRATGHVSASKHHPRPVRTQARCQNTSSSLCVRPQPAWHTRGHEPCSAHAIANVCAVFFVCQRRPLTFKRWGRTMYPVRFPARMLNLQTPGVSRLHRLVLTCCWASRAACPTPGIFRRIHFFVRSRAPITTTFALGCFYFAQN